MCKENGESWKKEKSSTPGSPLRGGRRIARRIPPGQAVALLFGVLPAVLSSLLSAVLLAALFAVLSAVRSAVLSAALSFGWLYAACALFGCVACVVLLFFWLFFLLAPFLYYVGSIFDAFWLHFGSILARFWTIFSSFWGSRGFLEAPWAHHGPKSSQNGFQDAVKADFERILGANMPPCWKLFGTFLSMICWSFLSLPFSSICLEFGFHFCSVLVPFWFHFKWFLELLGRLFAQRPILPKPGKLDWFSIFYVVCFASRLKIDHWCWLHLGAVLAPV